MKKKIKIQDLDCAACAAKIEDALKKLDGVDDANVSFITQKVTLVAEDSKMDDILIKAADLVSTIEPDAKLIIN